MSDVEVIARDAVVVAKKAGWKIGCGHGILDS